MRLAKLITNCPTIFLLILFPSLLPQNTNAQENSPYSRYGVGDLVPTQNIVSRGMGGVSAGYGQAYNINFVNPASLGNIYNTIFELGTEVDIRTIKSTSSPEKYRSNNLVISYLQLAFPVASKKMLKKDSINWVMSFGLRPYSRINYKINTEKRLTGIDSLSTLYEGQGGISQMNIGTALKFGKSKKREISIGAMAGYAFGNKDFSTRLTFINDTVAYYKSNYEVKSRFGGIFVNTGFQYLVRFASKRDSTKSSILKIGVYANLRQKLRAKQETINETFGYNGSGGTVTIDSVFKVNDVPGDVIIPGTYGGGFTYITADDRWLIGADFEYSNWSAYRYYNQQDFANNSWILRAGAEYNPVGNRPNLSRSFWNTVRYRAGFYFGPDYIKLSETRNNYAATVGATFPLTKFVRDQLVFLNTAIEAGGRGSRESMGVRETYLRINFGISMNAAWFRKRRYD
jgi:hypothetical protein